MRPRARRVCGVSGDARATGGAWWDEPYSRYETFMAFSWTKPIPGTTTPRA